MKDRSAQEQTSPLIQGVISVWGVLKANPMTYGFAELLHNTGISGKVNDYLQRIKDQKLREYPSPQMQADRRFFAQNRQSVEKMLASLTDEMSRIVWGGVVAYRVNREPLKKEWYSTKRVQYFLPDLIRIDEGEVFVDCGAYTGDTIETFLKIALKGNVQYRKIVAFEPDAENLCCLKKEYGNNGRICIIPKGLSDSLGTLLFKTGGDGSRIVEDESLATTKIPVIDIDHVPECHDATWIKMDIEGAEMSALRGAKETILRNHPKLTICIYHSANDMLRIPEYIHELVPQYRLYVRHHTSHLEETVLYAII